MSGPNTQTETTILHGYLHASDSPPPPATNPNQPIDYGTFTLNSWSAVHSKIWEYGSEVLEDGIPRLFKFTVKAFGEVPGALISIAMDLDSEGLLKATLTGVGSTVISAFVGGLSGAWIGGRIAGGYGAAVGFIAGAFFGNLSQDYADKKFIGPIYDDVNGYYRDWVYLKGPDGVGDFQEFDADSHRIAVYSMKTDLEGYVDVTKILLSAATQELISVETFKNYGDGDMPLTSKTVYDNNKNSAPAGTAIDPNKFYASDEFNTLNKISDATGTPITVLQNANPGVNPNTPLNSGTSVNLPPVDNSKAPIITVTANPTPQTGTPGQSDGANNTNQGYVSKSATSSVKYNNNTLNATTLAETTMAGMASGGVRPGEIQRDYNRPVNDSYNQVISWGTTTENPLPATFGNVLRGGVTHNVYIDPLLLDLGSGIGTTSFRTNPVFFDMDHSGTLKNTSWADSNTGILTIADANGKVTNISQLFSPYFGGTAGSNGGVGSAPFTNGFEALASVDSNGDGKITSSDAIWSQLRVWVDSNQSGSVGTGELKTLAQLGIAQINVSHTASEAYNNGNRISGTGNFVRNGQTVQMADVDLISDPTSTTLSTMGSGTLITSTTNGRTLTGYSDNSTQGATLNANTLGVDNLFAGSGNDTLIARTTGSMLVGGAGSDTYQGGVGDDVFVVSADDDPANISGGGGTDMLVVTGDAGMTINMAHAGVTIAEGGKGDDVIMSGGRKGVYIKGGIGNSLLIGGAGDDVIMGGSGHNTIIGGTGKAIIHAGPQGDLIYGAAGSSIINAGGGKDTIVGGASDDLIKVGMGNANIDGGGGTNLVEFHGSYAEYRIVKVDNGYWIADRTPNRDGTVFVTNVQKLNFSDIQAVDLTLPNALPVADTLRVNSTGSAFNHTQQHLISAAQLLVNDHTLASTGPLRISAVSNPIGGLSTAPGKGVELTPAGDVLFTPDPTYTGIMSFKYTVVDAQGHPAGTVVDLNTGQTAAMQAKVVLATPEIPTDPLIAKQWYLNDANILPVWKDYTGQGVRIGQFEPGGAFAVGPEIMNYNHADLSSNIDQTWLNAQKLARTLPTSFSNHATMVAGIMVAAKNGTGTVGVAYDAKISGHYLPDDGNDLNALLDMAKYDVVNHSWAIQPDFALSNQDSRTATIRSLYQYAADTGRNGLGTIIVGAAGNERANNGSAQASVNNNNRFTVQVGAINQQGDLSTLTNAQTPFSNQGASILVSAPGSNVASTSQLVVTDRGSIFGDNVSSMQGTSFATPIVSGITALMLEANPNLGYRDVQEILAMSAHTFNDPNAQWAYNGAKSWNGGGMHGSNDYGFGEVDALAAVRLAETWTETDDGGNEYFYTVGNNFNMMGTDINPGSTFTTSLSVSAGLQVEHVEVDLGVDFNQLKDLSVKLVSPTGTESLLLNANDPDSNLQSLSHTLMSTKDWGEQSTGNWTLKVTDATSGQPVHLNYWNLRLYGSKTSTDDTYFYTNEYASLASSTAARKTLNDSTNGIAGGINTINASAVTGNTSINLSSGQAVIGGTALTIQNPDNFHNIFTGDGNDTLTAGKNRALLDGGRGQNTLTGSTGQDYFVIRQRENGQDTITNFNTSNGEVMDLIGFTNPSFSSLVLTQQSSDVLVTGLGQNQSILIKNLNASTLNATHFKFHTVFQAPDVYVKSVQSISTPPSNMSVVNLNGGSSLSFSNGQVTFTGAVYRHDSASSDYFVMSSPSNNLFGYKPGIDKIDLGKLGIGSMSDLVITATNLGSTSGTNIGSNSLNGQGFPAGLVYLDGVTPAQLSASDFVFLPGNVAEVLTPPISPIAPNPNDAVPTEPGPIDPAVIGSNNGVTYTVDSMGKPTVVSSVNFSLPEHINKLVLTGTESIIGVANNNGNTLVSNAAQSTLVGGIGNDSYNINDSGVKIIEVTGGGIDSVLANVSYALSANVENLTLNGSDDLDGTGNALNNVITGNSGANILDGSTGNDTLIGGLGNDTYVVDSASDVITEGANAGTDTVQSSITYSLTTNANLENLTLTGTAAINATGNSGNNVLTGNDVANSLSGGSGNDTLASNGGNDTLDGGLGNDTYQFLPNYGTDTIADTGGTDTLDFSLFSTNVSVSIGANVINGSAGNSIAWSANTMENLTTGSGNDTLNGSSLANVLTGNAGNDTLIGLAGNDTMNGGMGDDSYLFADGFGVDSITDTSGFDTLDFSLMNSAITYNATTGSVTNGSNSVSFTPASTAFEKVIGGNANDTLTGGSSAETFVGGAGNDTFTGGSGNDAYVYANGWGSDSITAGSGIETVDMSDVTTALNVNMASGAGNEVSDGTNLINWTGTIENITTGSGSDTVNGTTGNNAITLGAGNDGVWGASGNDTLDGGAGNDRYVYTNGAWGLDSILDSSGTDQLDFSTNASNVIFNLTAGAGNEVTDGTSTINWTGDIIENVKAGTGNDSITGNSGANSLSGGNGNDTLNGGLGNDTLDGGAGDDRYVFINGLGTDSVIDASGNDTFDFSQITSAIIYNATSGTMTSSSSSLSFGAGTIEAVLGGSGADSFTGGTGSDSFTGGSGNDTLNGSTGNDSYFYANSWGSDSIVDASGTDTVNLSAVTTALNVNMAAGASNEVSDGTNLINWSDAIENLTTGSGSDTVNGTSGDNLIITGLGSDAIWAAGGNDTTDGGDGNDRYVYTNGAWGNDSILDSSGSDTLDFRTDASNLTVNLTAGAGNEATDGTSTLNWTGNIIENVWGGTGTNVINGNSSANSLIGNTGLNTLNGGAGNDTLQGGTGNSTYQFALGDGQDTITETGGTDVLSFNSSIAQINVAFFQSGGNLQIGYKGSTGDVITIQGQTTASSAVERFQLSNGNFMTSADVNSILQQMTSYASSNPGTDMSSITAVENNANLMNIVNGGWHS